MTQHGRAAAERDICRIAGVRAARLIAGGGPRGKTVRVLALPDRSADEIADEVRVVVRRATGWFLDRDDIDIVQLEDADAIPTFIRTNGTRVTTARASDTPPAAAEEPGAGASDTVAPDEAGAGSPRRVPSDRAGAEPAPPVPPTGTDAAEPDRALPDLDHLPAAVGPALPEPPVRSREPESCPGPGGRDRSPRVVLEGVRTARHDLRCTAEVTLHDGDRHRTGSAAGPAASSVVLRLVTEATLAALAQLRPSASALAVETSTVATAGERAVALVTLVLVGATHEEAFVGSALVREVDHHDAVARAALDAVNRRLQPQG